MNVDAVLVVHVVFFLSQQVFTAQSTQCKPGSNEPCDLYFTWQGCYNISGSLESTYEQALGYEELFRDTPLINASFGGWQSQIYELVCRCATKALNLDYKYFALQFYSVCFGGNEPVKASNRNERSCFEVNATSCEQSNQSLCFRVGNNNERGIAVYSIVWKNSTLPYAQCSNNKIVNGGVYVNREKSMTYKTGKIYTKNNETEDSKAALRRMLKELDDCFDIDQILKIIKEIMSVFGRPEIYESFDVFKRLQESFMGSLSRIVGDNFKDLWKETPKIQYLVEMVQEISVLTLRSLSLTNKTNYSFQTLNIDIAANISSDEALSLHFNSNTTDSSMIFDSNVQGIAPRPSSIAAILYKTINDIFPAIMNQGQKPSFNTNLSSVVSPVVSIVSLQDGKLIKQINGTIRLKKMIEQPALQARTNPECVYWKESPSLTFGGAWSTAGLSTDSFQNSTDYFTCRTNHLTSFAVLMQITDFEIQREHEYALQAITLSGCSLSLLCLLITIITIPLMRLKETRFLIHLHLCIALAASQALFLAGITAIKHKAACMVIAIVLHYFYTAAFMWMLVEGIHLYQKVVIAYQVRNVKERLYFLFAWGFPFVIVGIAFAANREGYGTSRGCWLSLEKGFRWAFITPVIVVLLANFVILIKVLMVMVTLQADPLRPEKHGKLRLACKGVAILLPLLGLTWFFGIMSVNSDTIVFQYLFAIFNSLQGVFIFAFNYVSNKEVRMSFRRTIQRSQITSLL
ncbi:adhesion G-protein coupled receptor D1-like [Actinia tenebrosa]|uniref:Adhesion G-protein coupled receptor D1-like n=1 Tax=Actinia tenebrosa TaxID=6105 RepID=A0A6P8IZ47_ACTTE|nr:adhesion G-protein coupled receptor D1-like [Actinia tenebrosa]XP_031571077.1 adhesion G-protein coupled receptor D1-like [Actinia tenebrosa]XP_031571087.1 adhesion G-protein coupled receptor D1-like [Actinia tenebrosa]XP_031571094.1 adhesion G-protein coupled receptor D1-like [Actinia tenebrosa]